MLTLQSSKSWNVYLLIFNENQDSLGDVIFYCKTLITQSDSIKYIIFNGTIAYIVGC